MYFSWATSLGGVFLSWLVLLLPFNNCCAVWALIHPQAKQGWGMTFSWCILETTVSKWIRQEVPLQNITFLKIHLFSSMLTQKTSRAGDRAPEDTSPNSALDSYITIHYQCILWNVENDKICLVPDTSRRDFCFLIHDFRFCLLALTAVLAQMLLFVFFSLPTWIAGSDDRLKMSQGQEQTLENSCLSLSYQGRSDQPWEVAWGGFGFSSTCRRFFLLRATHSSPAGFGCPSWLVLGSG